MLTFGTRIRELRREKGLNQRDLASRVGLDFTYLSKIENDRMPPPSKEAIEALAEHLDADLDELMVLAGRIPTDVAEVLSSNLDAVKLFRSMNAEVSTPEDWKKLLSNRSRDRQTGES